VGSSSLPLSSQSQILNQTIAAKSNSSGAATFTFPSPPAAFTWTGTLTCAAAPTTAVFVANVGAVSWGDWGGNSVYGPVQVLGQGAQQLVVTATGLTANTTYTLQWNGSSDPSNLVAAVWPDVNTSALQATISGAVATAPLEHVTSASAAYTITYLSALTQTQTLVATDASLFIQLTNIAAVTTYPTSGLTVTVTGLTTGLIYLQQSGIIAQNTLNLSCPVYGFVENVSLSILGPSIPPGGWSVGFNMQVIASSAPYVVNTMPVVNPVNTAIGNGIAQQLATVTSPLEESIGTYTGTLPTTLSASISYTNQVGYNAVTLQIPTCVAGTTYTVTMKASGILFTAGAQTQVFTATSTDPYTFTFALNLVAEDGTSVSFAVSSSTGASVTLRATAISVPNIGYTQQLPGQPNNDVPMGGLQSAYVASLATASPGSTILAAPAAGYAYRLHSFTTTPQVTAGTVFLWNGLTVRYGVTFPTATQYGSGMLNGLLVTGAIYMWANGTTPAAITGSLFYDTVRLPNIT